MVKQQPKAGPGPSTGAVRPAADRAGMRSAVFTLLVLAALAAMPRAHAGVEATTTDATSLHLAGTSAATVVPAARDGTSQPPESAPSVGGALFSPFAATPAKPTRRKSESAVHPSTADAGLTISLSATLAALAAIVWILRRVSR